MNIKQEIQYFWAAVMFYTRIPVPANARHSEEIFSHSRKYFPLIGVVVGFIATTTVLILQLFLPLSLAVLISIVITVLVTGAFHEDGFADCCDGFGGGWGKGQILIIMKDSRVGTYAVIGLFLLLSIKAISLYELGNLSLNLLLISYINGHALSRFGASLCIELLNYVQDIDKSKIKPITSKNLSFKALSYSFLFIFPFFMMLLFQNIIYIWSIFPLLLAFILGNHYFNKKIGGYTGDCLGAMQQVLEVFFYISILMLTQFT